MATAVKDSNHLLEEAAPRDGNPAWREVFNAASEAIFIHDVATGRILEVNDRMLEMYGYTRDEALQLSAGDGSLGEAPYSEQEAREWMRKAVETGPQLFEWRARRKDGELFWAEVSLRKTSIGGEGRVLAAVRDISTRKQAEEALRESEERYQALFQRSRDCVFLADFAGRFLDANQAALDLLGYRREDLPDLTFERVLGKDQLAQAFHTVQEISQTGSQRKVLEYRLRHRDGRSIDVETQSSLIYRQGKPWAIQGIARDITQHKRVEETLQRSVSLLRATLESTADGILVVDREGRIVDCNERFLQMWQVPPGMVAADRQKGLLQSESDDRLLQAVMSQLKDPEAFLDRVRALYANPEADSFDVLEFKDERVFERYSHPQRLAGQPVGRVWSFRDVTERERAEAALRESEVLLRESQQVARLGHYVLNIASGEWTASVVLEELFGIATGGEKTVADWVELIHPAERDEMLAYFNQHVLAGRRRFDREYRIVRRNDGAVRWVHGLGRLEMNAAGEPVRMFGTIQDVTERKRAEKQLRDSEQVYHSLVENLPQNIFRKDLAGRFTFANQRFCQSIGKPLGEILGRTDLDFWPPDLAAKYRQDDRRVIETGQSIELQEEHQSGTRQRQVVEVVKTPLRDAQGQITGVQGIFRDITAQKRAEEALSQSRADLELAQAVGHIGSWISELSPAGRLVWSAETCRIFGLHEHEFDGRLETFLEMVHPEDRATVRAARQAALAGEKPYDLEHRIVRRDRITRWVHEKAEVELDAAGQPIRVVGVVQDITAHRQLEEQLRHLQRMESVGQLAAGVAHDFNNILTVISGSASLLASALRHQPEVMELVHQVATAGERAANLTRQLLLFSRKQQMQPKLVNLNELTSNLTKMLGRILGEDVTLEFSYANELAGVHADPSMLEQVILNLAVNSRDAMPQGGRLQIATSAVEFTPDHPSLNPEARPGSFVRLTVSDTGCGIPREIQDRIFEPFFTTKEIGKGTGLGLATVYGIVKQHEGWIELESQPGAGTTFLIYLPASSPGGSSLEEAPTPPPTRGCGQLILVVEDDASVRDLLSQMLRRFGYEVLEAGSGVEALQFSAEQLKRVDALVTDLVMPGGFNGRELASTLRQRHPGLPILYCSGYSPDLAQGWLPGKEQATFLQKPFSPNEFLNAVAACLRSPQGV
jgi:two-component system, cell cycle sensor histidine kinase and response regulator CckA